MSSYTKEYAMNLIENTLKNFEVYRQRTASFNFIKRSDYAHFFESDSDSDSVNKQIAHDLSDLSTKEIKSERVSPLATNTERVVQLKRKSNDFEPSNISDDHDDLVVKKTKSEIQTVQEVNTERVVQHSRKKSDDDLFILDANLLTVQNNKIKSEKESPEMPKREFFSIFNKLTKKRNSCEPVHETSLIKTEQEVDGITFATAAAAAASKSARSSNVDKPRQKNPYLLEIKFAMGLTRQIFTKQELEEGHYPDIVDKCQSKLRRPLDPIKVAQVKGKFFERFKIEQSRHDQMWYSLRAQLNKNISKQFAKAALIKVETQSPNQVQ